MGRKAPRVGRCDYCGAIGVLTRDHVIPRNLFGGPVPSHPRPPIVHACPACNNEIKSDDDALLKDIHAVDYQVQQSGRAQAIFASTRKAVRQNESELAAPIREAKQVWVIANGLMVPAYEVKLPLQRVERALSNIVRGLSIYYAQRRMPIDTEYVVRRWYDVRQLDETLVMLANANAPFRSIGDGSVFDCQFAVSNESGVSLWILRFYESSFFSVSTFAPGTAPGRAYRATSLLPTLPARSSED